MQAGQVKTLSFIPGTKCLAPSAAWRGPHKNSKGGLGGVFYAWLLVALGQDDFWAQREEADCPGTEEPAPDPALPERAVRVRLCGKPVGPVLEQIFRARPWKEPEPPADVGPS